MTTKKGHLVALKIYIYRRSGRLIAGPISSNRYFSLNSDYSFSSRDPHAVRNSTLLEKTSLLLEVEVKKVGSLVEYVIVRVYHERDENLKPDTLNQVNISPSELFTSSERYFAGERLPQIWSLVCLCSIVWTWSAVLSEKYWWIPAILLILGAVGFVGTSRKPDGKILDDLSTKKRALREQQNARRLKKLATLDGWQRLSGVEFEYEVAAIYRSRGWHVEVTKRSHDGGIDLLMKNSEGRVAVQCKNLSKPVGISVIREMIGAKSKFDAQTKFWIVSLSGFSGAAMNLARQHDIHLVCLRDELLLS